MGRITLQGTHAAMTSAGIKAPAPMFTGEVFAQLTIEVVQHHLVLHRIFNCVGVFMWKTIPPSEMNEKQVDIHQKKRLQFTASGHLNTSET